MTEGFPCMDTAKSWAIMKFKVKETMELKQFREILTSLEVCLFAPTRKEQEPCAERSFSAAQKTIKVSASMPSHFYRASHPEKAALCSPVQKEKEEAMSQARTSILLSPMCRGVSF